MSQENLWAPWRLAYLKDGDRAASGGQFLTEYWRSPQLDESNFVIHRDERGMILLNRFPYANGHLMVALGEARPTLMDYEPVQRAALWKLIELAFDLMDRTLDPQGINMGINQGKAAGAGVPEHLHAHLVPRWAGDTNFMSVVGQVRVIPDSLEQMAKAYRKTVEELKRRNAETPKRRNHPESPRA